MRPIDAEPLMAELDRAERSLINSDEAKGVRLAEFLIIEAPTIDIDRPQGEFTKREYEQFLHGISLSLLSKRSAQYWGYEEETAQKIRWLEALEQKVRAKMEGADDE